VLAGTKEGVLMIESEAHELSEKQMLDAVVLGQDSYKAVIDAIIALAKKAAKDPWELKEKEDEIKRLDQEQVNLKNEIDQNKDEYEKLIDTTTSEIENFLKKASSDNSVQ